MAKKRPRDAVQFTLESAERIASVVRAAETQPPATAPLRFSRQPAAMPSGIKLARYTATTSLVKGAVRPVVFMTASTSAISFSGITATAINRFAIIPGHTGSGAITTDGVLLSLQKVGGIWTVMNAES